MSEYVPPALIAEVRRRANELCEYCLLPQWSQEATFHIDHILPVYDGGGVVSENLALACVTCSLRKGARTNARDPETEKFIRLFHPRRDKWHEHFRWTADWRLSGRTAVGRATIRALKMNRPAVVLIRQIWADLGLFPPDLEN